jgi:hypothetical protein
MTKIRNINLSGKCQFGYAGPVCSGRGASRKCPDDFSGAAPPASSQLTVCTAVNQVNSGVDSISKPNKNKLIALFAAVVCLCMIFAGCANGNNDPSDAKDDNTWEAPSNPGTSNPTQNNKKHNPTTKCNGECVQNITASQSDMFAAFGVACAPSCAFEDRHSHYVNSFAVFDEALMDSWEKRDGDYHANIYYTTGDIAGYRFKHTADIDGNGMFRLPCFSSNDIAAAENAGKQKMAQYHSTTRKAIPVIRDEK